MSHPLLSLVAAMESISRQPTRQKTIRAALAAVNHLFQARRSTLLLPGPGGRNFQIYHFSGRGPLRFTSAKTKELRDPEAWVLAQGKLLDYSRPQKVSAQSGRHLKHDFLFTRLLAVPLDQASGPRGVLLAVDPSRPRGGGRESLARLQLIGQTVLLAMARHRAPAPSQRGAASAPVRGGRGSSGGFAAGGKKRAEVLATVVHELRSPITSITGFAKLLLKNPAGRLAEEQIQFCQIILQNAHTLERLITDLADVAAISKNDLQLQVEPVALNDAVRETALAFEAGVPPENRRLRFQDSAPGVRVRADRLRLRQVVRNLFENALKYARPGSAIRVGVTRTRTLAQLTVTSSGEPLRPDQLHKVFEKFYRIQTAAGLKIPGSGLGLAIVKNIIEAHGGRAWAENTHGGNAFSVTLPVSRTDG